MATGVIFSSLFIDIITLVIVQFKNGIKFIFTGRLPKTKYPPFNVSIVIPAYNEEENIEEVIDSAFNQTHPPKQVIVIDDYSSDNTLKSCSRAKQKYKNLKILTKKENKGKAHSVSYVLENINLSEITIVLDADTFLSKDYIKEITKPFLNKRVAIVTGISLPIKASNFFGKIIYHGATFQYKFFCFRKKAHALRNAMAVICGDSSAYRTSFLKKIKGFPQGTETEDMDITWIALENGYRIDYQKNALARSKDPSTFKGHIKQIMRWYSGSIQCLYKHNKELLKAKSLLFTTLIPIYFDTLIYAPLFAFSLFLFFIYPKFAIAFYLADFIFTLLAILYLDWKLIRRLPEIYIIKFIWSTVWFIAFIKTTLQYIFGKRNWGGGWDRSSFYTKKKSKLTGEIKNV